MNNLSLIFPMAGQGARFGYQFKPFLDFRGRPFIDMAFESFRPWLDRIGRVYFIYLEEQDRRHHVSARLSGLFSGVDIVPVILPQPTPGPAETLAQCLARRKIEGAILVCDCDHALGVEGLMRIATGAEAVDCALPTWDLTDEPLSAWSVAAIDPHDRVTSIAEKRMPAQGHRFRGVVGCYYFADALRVQAAIADRRHVYLSDIVRHYIEDGASVRSVALSEATFFGDPARLEQALGQRVSPAGRSSGASPAQPLPARTASPAGA